MSRLSSTIRRRKIRAAAMITAAAFAGIAAYLLFSGSSGLDRKRDDLDRAFLKWASGDPDARAELVVSRRTACPGAPFLLPTDGFIGLLYNDPRGPYSNRRPHQGIDIFSNTDAGVTPVYAAYDGYVTRESGWKSTLILRVPQDPLHPEQQIWLYYTHMADEMGNDHIVSEFPPGTSERFVRQGTLLGYTGNYNGNSLRRIWVHLHFSIVKDDGNGRYLNELEFANTLDPSPYLGMGLNYGCSPQSNVCSIPSSCDG